MINTFDPWMTFVDKKMIREKKHITGLTKEGQRSIMMNIIKRIEWDLNHLYMEVTNDSGSSYVYNSYIFSITIALQSVLDSVTRFCNDLHPSEHIIPGSNIYFNTYSFHQNEFRNIVSIKKTIQELKYNNYSFNDFSKYIET
jgi:hypothetical protein